MSKRIECREFFVITISSYEVPGVVSYSKEALADFVQQYSKEIDQWSKEGRGSSLSIYLIDKHDRDYSQLTRQEIDRWRERGVFIS